MIRLLKTVVSGIALALMVTTGAQAQWLDHKTPGVPRTADGSPKLDAPTPRFFDGHPDLTGVWMHDLTPVDELRRLFGPLIEAEIQTEIPGMEAGNIHKHAISVLIDIPPDQSPARPETQKVIEARRASGPPPELCGATGRPGPFPAIGLLSEPIKIVQAPQLTLVLHEIGGNFRQIFTDGRRPLTDINLPAYFGYSTGRWDRETFVVETNGFNDRNPLDMLGHPHSDQLRIVERYRRPNFGRLEVEMTYEDPKMYTRPFTISLSYHLLADADIFEMVSDNEKDCARIRAARTK